MKSRRPNVVAVGGTDPLNGAGVTADMATLAARGCHGLAVVSAVVAQNSRGVSHVLEVPMESFFGQLEAISSDVPVEAVKVGMLASLEQASMLLGWIRRLGPVPVVYDPVMAASAGGDGGGRLMQEGMLPWLIESFLPACTLATPNAHEFERLQRASRNLGTGLMDKTAFLVKGGHGKEMASGWAVDRLLADGKTIDFRMPAVRTVHDHGTGCMLSSAIAACLAWGMPLEEAVKAGKQSVHEAVAAGRDIGNGHGPVDPWGGRGACHAGPLHHQQPDGL